MAVAFVEVARPLKTNKPELPSSSVSVAVATAASASVETSERDLAFAKRFLSKFDKDRDGRVLRSEVNRIVNDFVFNQIDENRDGTVTQDELVLASKAKRGR